MAHPGEVPAHTAAAGAAMDSNVLAIVIAATVSTSVFIVAILILLLLLYHRDPMCCQFLCSCRFFQTPSQYMPPPYEHALRHPPAFSGTVISSETLDRRGVPDPFQAPLSYQTQRNTAV
ncbi:hypothetical protein GRJ2_002241900 [Grus japonensis]|uniref:Uncharacterized protein n=1 Tax=Grus japonensis TaxID=30415 RepID=A0ABC9XJA4_GRUJA